MLYSYSPDEANPAINTSESYPLNLQFSDMFILMNTLDHMKSYYFQLFMDMDLSLKFTGHKEREV
jgi:hypothetical protein